MKIAVNGTFNGYSIKKDGMFSMKFKFPLVEMPKAIQFVTLIQKPLKARVVTEDEKINLGVVVYKSMRIDKDGEVALELEGDAQTIDAINAAEMVEKQIKLIAKHDDGETSESAEEEKPE